MGGQHLRAAGAKIIGDTTGLGVIGFTTSLALVPRTLRLKGVALRELKRNRPDAAVLCDWGGFNVRILEELNELGIPVLYYFPPRSWQKTGSTNPNLAKYCRMIATPFPWSAERLAAAGAKVEWVGHPLLETVTSEAPKAELRARFGAKAGQRLIGMLPGSRSMELKYIAPPVAEAARLLEERHPDLVFAVAAAPGTATRVKEAFPKHYSVVEGAASELLLACDAAIVKSGTSTLEAAVAGAPQVVVYEVPPLLHAQVTLTGLRRKIPFVSMPNIILERAAVEELLGENCRGPVIAEAMEGLLSDQVRVAALRSDYEAVREVLGAKLPVPATARTADLVEELVHAP